MTKRRKGKKPKPRDNAVKLIPVSSFYHQRNLGAFPVFTRDENEYCKNFMSSLISSASIDISSCPFIQTVSKDGISYSRKPGFDNFTDAEIADCEDNSTLLSMENGQPSLTWSTKPTQREED